MIGPRLSLAGQRRLDKKFGFRDSQRMLLLFLSLLSPGAPVVGQPAPSFVLATVNAEASGHARLSTRALKAQGIERLVLAFAASYCAPCKQEIPALEALVAARADPRLVVAVVVTDKEPAGQAAMQSWLAERVTRLPVVLDRYGLLARRYGVTELPHTALLDGDGLLRWVHTGFAADALDGLRAALGASGRTQSAGSGP